MATVTSSTSVIASAEATINAIKAQVASVEAAAAAQLSSITATLTAHAAAHQAEVDAATALIAKASPASTATAQSAAAIILTSPGWLQTAVADVGSAFGKNWRYAVLAVSLGIIAYAKFKLHLL